MTRLSKFFGSISLATSSAIGAQPGQYFFRAGAVRYGVWKKKPKMKTLQFHIFLVFVTVIEMTVSVTVTNKKMTWEDVFKDRLQINSGKRQHRSQLTTKKAFVLDPSEHGQYSLQYIDQYAGSQYQDQSRDSFQTDHDYSFYTVKDAGVFGKDKLKSDSAKTALSFIYTEADQPTQFVTESYKYLTVPQTDLHRESDLFYHKTRDHDNNDDYAAKYKFGYRVSDPHTGAEFGHSEVSEGHTKKGHYHVLLPDGRLQNVKYWADPSGYHATVTYEGHGYHYPSHR